MVPRGFAPTLALALILAPHLLAQEAEPEPGTRVRVTLSEQVLVSQRRGGGVLTESKEVVLTGAVATWELQTLVLDVGKGTQRAIPRSQISKLEVSLGKRSNMGKGAWIGAIAGFVAGFGTTALLCGGSKCDDQGSPDDADLQYALIGGALLAPLGAGIGAGIGAANKTDRWEDVTAQRPPVAMGVGRDGSVLLALSLKL